jgi:hypothetical protein
VEVGQHLAHRGAPRVGRQRGQLLQQLRVAHDDRRLVQVGVGLPQLPQRRVLLELAGRVRDGVLPGDPHRERIAGVGQRRIAGVDDLVEQHRVARRQVLRAHLGRVGRVPLAEELGDLVVGRQRDRDAHVARGHQHRLREARAEHAIGLLGRVDEDVGAPTGVRDGVHQRVVHAVADPDAHEVDPRAVLVAGVLADELLVGLARVRLPVADDDDAVDRVGRPELVGQLVARVEPAAQICPARGLQAVGQRQQGGVRGPGDRVPLEHRRLVARPGDRADRVAFPQGTSDRLHRGALELHGPAGHRARRVEHQRQVHRPAVGGRCLGDHRDLQRHVLAQITRAELRDDLERARRGRREREAVVVEELPRPDGERIDLLPRPDPRASDHGRRHGVRVVGGHVERQRRGQIDACAERWLGRRGRHLRGGRRRSCARVGGRSCAGSASSARVAAGSRPAVPGSGARIACSSCTGTGSGAPSVAGGSACAPCAGAAACAALTRGADRARGASLARPPARAPAAERAGCAGARGAPCGPAVPLAGALAAAGAAGHARAARAGGVPHPTRVRSVATRATTCAPGLRLATEAGRGCGEREWAELHAGRSSCLAAAQRRIAGDPVTRPRCTRGQPEEQSPPPSHQHRRAARLHLAHLEGSASATLVPPWAMDSPGGPSAGCLRSLAESRARQDLARAPPGAPGMEVGSWPRRAQIGRPKAQQVIVNCVCAFADVRGLPVDCARASLGSCRATG